MLEVNEVVTETVVAAEAQADNETPTTEAETIVVEEAQADNETPTAEAETPVLEVNEVVAETVVAAEAQVDNEAPTAEVETPVLEANDVETETAVVAEVQADNETPTAEAETPVLEANEVEAETAVVEEPPTTEHEETLVFTMETEVFAETAPIDPAVLEAQTVIKKNKPKKKQHLIHLLAQTLRLETAVAQDLVQQLQAAGNITIDAAENIKYCS